MRGIEAERQRSARRSEVGFAVYDGSHVVVHINAPDREYAPGSRLNIDTAKTAILCLASFFAEVPNKDRTFCPCRHRTELLHQRPDAVRRIHVRAAEVGLNGIEDAQPCAGAEDGFLDALIREGKLLFLFIDEVNAVDVRAELLQPRHDGVGEAILGVLDDDVGCGKIIDCTRQRVAARDRGRNRHGGGGLAIPGVALDDGDFAERDVRLPQPLDRLRNNVPHGNDFWLRHHATSKSFARLALSLFCCAHISSRRTWISARSAA